MSSHSWYILGKALGTSKHLRNFAVHACNLYADDNFKKLLSGMIRPIDTKKAILMQKEEKKQQGKEVEVHFARHGSSSQLNDSRLSKISNDSESQLKEPFVYNYKPKVQKANTKETPRQKMAKEPRTFGASIETLDFSDNDLNDSHG